ncbi:hypothetical protein [Actinomadura kijaniata]|uniref:hypothetical protein n=1 Tax=Actinomadura kijaniata TaxID=46161 RepID=UPI00082EEFE6|nr:hypothetical protein [Actinomadura kijaniata]
MAPLYLTPPSSEPIRALIRSGHLGMITSPAQGNRIEPAYRHVLVDNGAFTSAYVGDLRYLAYLDRLQQHHGDQILAATAPDVVGDHAATWARSTPMLQRIRALGMKAAFVAQDGMEWEHSAWIWDEFDVLFVGGTTRWKISAVAAQIARAAHDHGKWVHVGRVNSQRRTVHCAQAMWADSVDGTYLTRAPDLNLRHLQAWTRFVDTQDSLLDVPDLLLDDDGPTWHHLRQRLPAPTTAPRPAQTEATLPLDDL